MKYLFHQKKYGAIFVCCFFILLSASVFAAETAPWPMFLHDSSHTGRSTLPGPSRGDILWAFPITAGDPSSPIVGPDGTVYVGSETGLYAVNPDGTQKWKFATGRQIISSPAIDINGIVYFGCLDSKIYAIYPDGSQKWSELTGGEIHSSPLITSDGLIVTGASDGSVYAYLSTGTLKWKYTPVGESDWVYASPAIGPDGTLYVATNKGVLALDISGATPTRKWFHPVITSDLKSSPAIGSDGSIYIGTRDNTLLSLKSDGSVRWTYSILGDIRSSPVIGPDGTIHIANISITDSSARFLYAINPNGTNKWSSPTGGNVFDQSPAVDCNGVVYLGCADNFVHAIDAGGSEIWRFPGRGGPFSSIAIGKNQTLYFVTTGGSGYEGYLYAVGPPSPSSPIWPMFRHDSFHTGKSPSMGPTTDNLKWSIDTGTFSVNPANNELFSSPVIDTFGTVYIGGSSLKAYYPDGTLKWDFNSVSLFMSSPAIGNDGIIYAADLAGRLYALNPATGTEIRRCAIGSAIYSSPVIGPGGIIYIGSTDGKVRAINPANMLEIWTSTTGGPVPSSPAIGLDGSIYVGSTDGVFYAFNSSDGSLKWKYPSSGVSTLGAIKSSPAVDISGNIYFGTANRVVALKPDGSFYWNFSPPDTSFDSSPAIVSQDGVVYIGSINTGGAGGGSLYALSASDGSLKWSYGCGGVLSSPVIGADGLIYFGDVLGKIIALKSDATLQWVYSAVSTSSSSSPAIGLYKNLYIGSRNTTTEMYKLYAFGTPSAFIKLPAASLQTNSVNAYRMIGIPVMPTDFDTFNSLKTYWGGVYDPLSWRLFAYSGGAYTEISASGQDYISPGKGWLIISANEKQIEIPGAILATDFWTSVGTGYILLACPFQDESVVWTTVVNGNTPLLLGANLYCWDGSGNYAVSPNMEPGKSYLAWVGNAGILRINRHSATAAFAGIRNHSSMQRTDTSTAESMSCQPPPPLAPGAFIHVSSPNGKENWIGGEQHQITWNSLGISPEGFVSTVDIALSHDGGDTYDVIEIRYPNSGFYNWRIPNGITSDRCLIKITSSTYPGTSNVSDTFFSIR
jgi:outer membrane protein assembly factor BamB